MLNNPTSIEILAIISAIGGVVAGLARYVYSRRKEDREDRRIALRDYQVLLDRNTLDTVNLKEHVEKLSEEYQECLGEKIKMENEIANLTNLAKQLGRGQINAVVTTDDEGKITDWSAGAEVLFGWTADYAIGKDMYFFIPASYRSRHLKAFLLARNSPDLPEGIKSINVHALTKSGEEIPVVITPSGYRNHDGKVFFSASFRLRTQ